VTTETEDILWIAAQQDQIIPRELIMFAEEKNKTLYELIQMEETDFSTIDKNILGKFVVQRENIPFQAYQRVYDQMQKERINMIKYTDPLFPYGLKKLKDKGVPVMLYHQGKKMSFVNCIAVVGTRNCSTHATEIGRNIGRELSKSGYVIVTGLARGTDAAAHRGAISVNGKTVGVLPWIHEPYPPEHERLMYETKINGCIISEHFFQTPKYGRYNFLQRNAVISGISELLIAVESSYSGGTRWQVELALSQGKTVIAIEPERSNELAYDGYKRFLGKGAIGASSSEDALEIVQHEVKLREQTVEDEFDEAAMVIDREINDFTEWKDTR
jgi:DNA processing protein